MIGSGPLHQGNRIPEDLAQSAQGRT